MLSEEKSKVRKLESELKTLNERVQLESRGKLSEYGSMEKRVQEMSENERRLN